MLVVHHRVRENHAVHVYRKLARRHTSCNHGLDQLYGIKCCLEADEIELYGTRPGGQAIPRYLVKTSDYSPHPRREQDQIDGEVKDRNIF